MVNGSSRHNDDISNPLPFHQTSFWPFENNFHIVLVMHALMKCHRNDKRLNTMKSPVPRSKMVNLYNLRIVRKLYSTWHSILLLSYSCHFSTSNLTLQYIVKYFYSEINLNSIFGVYFILNTHLHPHSNAVPMDSDG